MEKTIYDLELHETLCISEIGANVTRVASGWLYTYKKEAYLSDGNLIEESTQIIFVPYDNSFQNIR